jgi:hypothetical protein
LLLFSAISGMVSAQNVIAMSDAEITRADGVSVPETAMPVVGAGVTGTTDAGARYAPVRFPLKLGSSPPRLQVDIVFDGPPMPRKLEASVIEEIALIWAAYGVGVQTSSASDVRRDSAVRLAVMLADRPDARVAPEALGSIVFVDDVPKPTIAMYPTVIAELVAKATLNGSYSHEWPVAFHDVIVARVLGRALAHEIGHFLLRSRNHSAVGLMQASQSLRDLIAPNRERFVLSADEVTRLASITATASQSSPAAARPAVTPSR